MPTTKKEQQKKADEKRKGLRTRNYATVVYPESAPAGWQERLNAMHVESVVSPLHDQDCNPDGEVKKAHYHVLMMWSSVKTKEQAAAAFEEIGGVGVEPVASVRGMARYLCHLDNPEKVEYSVDDVKCFGGADYLSLIDLPTDKYVMLAEMMDFCDEHGVDEYWVLCKYARRHRQNWWRCLADNGSSMMQNYLTSVRHSSGSSNTKFEELEFKLQK